MDKIKIVDLVFGPGGPVMTLGKGNREVVSDTIVEHDVMLSVTFQVRRHLQSCERCSTVAPPPTGIQLASEWGAEALLALANHYLLVSEHVREHAHYMPTGWKVVCDKILCGPCAEDVEAALANAMQPRRRTP